ncbi:MAG: hypothetical protein ACOZCL_15005 [Bacillota bacterium]
MKTRAAYNEEILGQEDKTLSQNPQLMSYDLLDSAAAIQSSYLFRDIMYFIAHTLI